jgi:hypothetical protein
MPSRRPTREAERVQARARRRAVAAEAGRGPCGPRITPLAGVVVTLGATVTSAHLDAPDLLGRRGGLGARVRMWQA